MRVAKVKDSLETALKAGIEVDSIIDVGIQHATPVLIDLFPNHHHYLFEPVAEYFPHIRKNYADISFDLIEAAVSDFDGELALKSEKKTRGDEISHSYIVDKPTSETRPVQALQLDSYFGARKAAGPHLLKIDVEGPEVPSAILRGASQLLENCSLVMIEMTVDKFMDRALILHNAGFELWDICDLCYYGDNLWQVDVMFIKSEIKNANMALRPMHKRPFEAGLWQSGF